MTNFQCELIKIHLNNYGVVATPWHIVIYYDLNLRCALTNHTAIMMMRNDIVKR